MVQSLIIYSHFSFVKRQACLRDFMVISYMDFIQTLAGF